MQLVGTKRIDLLFCDLQMPGISGLELVRRIHEHDPDLPGIVMAGDDTPENSVAALRAGAFWVLEKPFEDARLDLVRRLAEKAIEHGRLCSENRALKSQLQARRKLDHIIGKSAPLVRILALVEKLAETDSPVLVTGERGTGRTLVVRAVHDHSRRAHRPLVTVHCGAIREELLECELFGQAEGASNGAFISGPAQREGRFAAADGGSLFLNDIGDLTPKLQMRLLRVLEDRSVEPALRTWAPRVRSTCPDFKDVVTRFENDLIAQALDQTNWNKNRAAGLLGLNRTTLLEKINKRGLQRPGSLL